MPERPAPLVLVATPATDQPFGSHAAVAAEGQRLLAAELSHRLGRLGAAVAPLPFEAPPDGGSFHWGRWYAAAARRALATGNVDAVGYAGAGALALLDDEGLDNLLSPVPGEVVANNRFSADAFVVAGDLDRALATLEDVRERQRRATSAQRRRLGMARPRRRPPGRGSTSTRRLDLALLRLATRLDGTRALDGSVRGFLEMARLPGDRPLEVPNLDRIGAVIRDRSAELVVAGRVPTTTWQMLETETACRVRGLVEERGMRSSGAGQVPRSILAALMDRSSPTELVAELARLGDAVVLDTRVLMAAVAGSAEATTWPPEEERFASDFGDASRVATPWLRELVEAAATASVPMLFGGHALVSDGLRLIVSAAWQGR